MKLFSVILLSAAVAGSPCLGADGDLPWPGAEWSVIAPETAGMSSNQLVEFSQIVGGRGCVVRHGAMVFTWGEQSKSSDLASAFKPLLSTLMLMAVEEGRIGDVDEPIVRFEPRLHSLNGGKDAKITWRHLASQMSAYGLSERPGEAYAYNDFAITLYYDLLMEKVFRTNGTEVLRSRLAEPLQFQDSFTFNAFGPGNRPGRLALSCRDFARFGLMVMRGGRWGDRQILQSDSIRLSTSSPISSATPLTKGRSADMLPGQRSMGGGKNITSAGPGCYSFNWWLNLTNASGQRFFLDAPANAIVASGHGGKRALVIMPGLDLLAVWNDSLVDDHDKSPGNPRTRNNRALKSLIAACQKK